MRELRWSETALPQAVEALAFRVRAAAYRVHSALGPGFLESAYRRALAHALRTEGLRVEEEVWLSLEFEGLRLERIFRADIVVEGVLLVEVKAVDALHPVHKLQVLSYLKAGNYVLGYLMNFNEAHLRDGTHRLVHPRFLRED